jgi:hypothetical protein
VFVVAAMPLVVDSTQAKHLAPNMPKIISEQNYKSLPVTGNSWFNRQKKTQVIAMGGQVRMK